MTWDGAGAAAAAGRTGSGDSAAAGWTSAPRVPVGSLARRAASASRASSSGRGAGFAPDADSATMSCSSSQASKRTSSTQGSNRLPPLRKTSTRSSALCASAAVASSAIDALIPFTLWAWRKRLSTTERESPSPEFAFSSFTRSDENAARCSAASAR